MESGIVRQHLSRIAERFAELSAGNFVVEGISSDGCDYREGGSTPAQTEFFPQFRHT